MFLRRGIHLVRSGIGLAPKHFAIVGVDARNHLAALLPAEYVDPASRVDWRRVAQPDRDLPLLRQLLGPSFRFLSGKWRPVPPRSPPPRRRYRNQTAHTRHPSS